MQPIIEVRFAMVTNGLHVDHPGYRQRTGARPVAKDQGRLARDVEVLESQLSQG